VLLSALYSVIWLGTIYALYINEFAAGWYIAGLSLSIVGVTVRLKALHDLGRNYSHEVAIHADHQLVTSGIYGWV
jgi:protein-S-isoprenylcysteine O-methyltransferase Ste14